MRKKQLVKCDVYDCKHCLCDDKLCNLDTVKISNCSDEESKDSTICDSYKKRD